MRKEQQLDSFDGGRLLGLNVHRDHMSRSVRDQNLFERCARYFDPLGGGGGGCAVCQAF